MSLLGQNDPNRNVPIGSKCFFQLTNVEFYRNINMLGGVFMWKEFKEFAMRGNIMDLAVGVIIRRCFSKDCNIIGK